MPENVSTKTAQNWKSLLICPDSRMSAHFLPLAAHQVSIGSIFELPSYPYRSVLNETLAGKNPQLCFLDASSDPERSLATIESLLAIQPSLQIVVLLTHNDPDLILHSLRQGATEFLIEPFTADQLRPALDKLARLRPGGAGERQGMGRVICVMPAKGASGATTIACGLAIQWRRVTSKKVLLADLDPLTGTVSFVLKTKSPYSFMDAIHRAATLDEEVWKALVTVSGGVDVMLSPDNPVDGIHEAVDPTPVIDVSRQLYDVTIVDSSGAYGDWNLSLAQLCDEILMVTTNELSALQAAQRAISYLETHQVPRSKIRLVVNRYNYDIGLSKDVIETALHMDVFHLIPSDYEAIQAATLEGKQAPSNTVFGRQIAALTELMTGKSGKVLPPKKASAFAGFLSCFSKKPAVSR